MNMEKRKILLKIYFFLFASLLFFFQTKSLLAFGGCEQDCIRCHTLSLEEATNVLNAFDSDIKVEHVQMAPSKGLWEITIESKGRKGIAYLDFAKENLILGQIVKVKTKKNLTMERILDLSRVDVSTIPLEDALVMGDEKAEKRVIVFDDPD